MPQAAAEAETELRIPDSSLMEWLGNRSSHIPSWICPSRLQFAFWLAGNATSSRISISVGAGLIQPGRSSEESSAGLAGAAAKSRFSQPNSPKGEERKGPSRNAGGILAASLGAAFIPLAFVPPPLTTHHKMKGFSTCPMALEELPRLCCRAGINIFIQEEPRELLLSIPNSGKAEAKFSFRIFHFFCKQNQSISLYPFVLLTLFCLKIRIFHNFVFIFYQFVLFPSLYVFFSYNIYNYNYNYLLVYCRHRHGFKRTIQQELHF